MSHLTSTSVPYDRNADPRQIWNERNSGNTPSEIEFLRIIAKINDLEAWKQLKVVNFGTITPSPPNEWIVTAQITSDQLHYIRSQPFVLSLEHGRLVGPSGPKESATSNKSLS